HYFCCSYTTSRSFVF
nr:immunoglobulin light chain junction region [Macaca mulatta]MOW03815.1 immunoglobulin light chain junction region [Macaca mulatta]